MINNKPNILLLFTDMQRFDTIGALNNPAIQTPNLDRLVREGTSFASAYSPCPVCVPARWCMHYGQYPRKSGLYVNGRMPEDNGKSLPAVLGKQVIRLPLLANVILLLTNWPCVVFNRDRCRRKAVPTHPQTITANFWLKTDCLLMNHMEHAEKCIIFHRFHNILKNSIPAPG